MSLLSLRLVRVGSVCHVLSLVAVLTWTLVGSRTFEVGASAMEIGPVVVPSQGGLPVKVDAVGSAGIFYGYALLSYLSSYGEEMGRILVWPRAIPTVYLLGDGVRVRDTFGVLVFDPRKFARRWLEPPGLMSIRVLADLPGPSMTDSHTPPGFSDSSGRELSFSSAGGAARLTFPS